MTSQVLWLCQSSDRWQTKYLIKTRWYWYQTTLHRIKISNQQRTQNRSVNLQRIRDLAGILNRENQGVEHAIPSGGRSCCSRGMYHWRRFPYLYIWCAGCILNRCRNNRYCNKVWQWENCGSKVPSAIKFVLTGKAWQICKW